MQHTNISFYPRSLINVSSAQTTHTHTHTQTRHGLTGKPLESMLYELGSSQDFVMDNGKE